MKEHPAASRGAAVLGGLLLFAGCVSGGDAPPGGVARLEVWAHSGQEAERDTLRQQIERFNHSQDSVRAVLTLLPERSYNAQVQAAAAAGDLPDVLECDGPYLSNYAWQGHLAPLDDLVREDVRADLLPSIIRQGTYRGQLFGVGTFDSGLGLFARKSALDAAGVRIPAGPEESWSVREFDAVLSALAARDEDGAVLDLKLNQTGEWYTYAFLPSVHSAGGDILRADPEPAAAGALNGPQAVAAMSVLRSWLARGLVDPNVDDAAFVRERVALSWAGHWEYRRYAERFGDDLVLLPLPDYGHGTRTGQGSWVWTVAAECADRGAAADFIDFLLRTEEVLAMASANGAVPATRAAVDRSELYGEGGPLALFARQLAGGYSVPRPRTPAYPTITSAFQQVVQDIRDGRDPQAALDHAVATIEEDLRDNRGYADPTGD